MYRTHSKSQFKVKTMFKSRFFMLQYVVEPSFAYCPQKSRDLSHSSFTALQFGGALHLVRAGRRSWGTIVLSREWTERPRTIPSFWKENEHIERVLKNIETICKETVLKGIEIAWKERLKSGMRSYYQKRVLSRERILNQECVLNHLK